MLCKNCGAPLNGTAFCTNCGAKADYSAPAPVSDMDATVMTSDAAAAFGASQAEQPAYQPPVYQEPVQPSYQPPVYQEPVQPTYQPPVYQEPVQPTYQPPVYQDQSYGYAAPQYQPEPPKKGNKGLIIGIAVASVIAVAAIVLIILFATGVIGGEKENKDKDDETTAAVSEIVEQSESASELISDSPSSPNNQPTAPVITDSVTSDSPVSNLEIGRSYAYLPVNIKARGYQKMMGSCIFSGDKLYVEADYGDNIYNNGGIIYMSYPDEDLNFNIVIKDGYFWVYMMIDDEITDVTSEYESEDVEQIISMVELMGFNVDEAFSEFIGATPSSYTYAGIATHPSLGTVEVFNFEVEGSTYVIWIDQDTGVTARLYEDGENILDFSSAYANNSLTITDYSNS